MMTRVSILLLFAYAGFAAADDTNNITFHSDVALVRVDAQVLDRENRAITGLRVEDFVLREQGHVVPIRNFASENMPIDILLLLDVSGSMRVHVQRLADACHEAMHVLGKDDRIGIMVFDRGARLRMPFRNSRDDVNREMERLLQQETFDGGTDITHGMLRAAEYVRTDARRDARRAIVIMTDDQTQKERDEASVGRALERADAVMSLLLAPDAMANRGGMGRHGGGYPGAGGGPLGGIIFPRRGGYGQPGGGMGGQTHSAGTAEIAKDSGGDAMSVDDASALETTLERLRQRYALYFHMPEGSSSEGRSIELDLADSARRRYPTAEIKYRRVYLAAGGEDTAGPLMVTHAPDHVPVSTETDTDYTARKHRVAVDEPTGGPMINMGSSSDATAAAPSTPATDAAAAPAPTPAAKPGWRRVDPDPPPPGPIKPQTQER
jgi:VWFA-related protein